jgi:hypothetical protein
MSLPHDTILLPKELVNTTPKKVKNNDNGTLVLTDNSNFEPSPLFKITTKTPKSSGKKKKAENFEDLMKINGSEENTLDKVSKGENLTFDSTICSLVKKGKIIFKNEISKGKYGTTLLSKVKGLKKDEEYVVKIPHVNKLPSCTTKSMIYKRNDGNGKTVFPDGSYSCDGEFSEFIISLFVADLMRKKQSINFLDTFYFARCINKDSFIHFMFMEKADTTLRKELAYLSNEDINSLYIQLLHALAFIQHKYLIVHSDLHLDNILLKMIKTTAACRTYKFDNETIYAPPCKYIAFPADWGMSVKYSKPMVGNVNVLKGFYGDSTPNFFSSAYDILFLTKSFLLEMKKHSLTSNFIERIYDWMIFKTVDVEPKLIYYFKNDSITYRPLSSALDTYFSHVSPLNILNNFDLMGDYVKKPKNICAFGGEF